MIQFLSIQSTYHSVELALFNNDSVVTRSSIPKIKASSNLIPELSSSLEKNGISFDELDFIAVNQGPGPFTTLRVVIATANGLQFASNKPLIGIDALDAFLQEYHDPTYPITVVLLNAFNKDVYFGIQQGTKIDKGYKNNLVLLAELKEQFPNQMIRFLGNGTSLYEDAIRDVFHDQAIIPAPLPQTCSIEQIGLMGLHNWEKRERISNQLLPLYLKKMAY